MMNTVDCLILLYVMSLDGMSNIEMRVFATTSLNLTYPRTKNKMYKEKRCATKTLLRLDQQTTNSSE